MKRNSTKSPSGVVWHRNPQKSTDLPTTYHIFPLTFAKNGTICLCACEYLWMISKSDPLNLKKKRTKTRKKHPRMFHHHFPREKKKTWTIVVFGSLPLAPKRGLRHSDGAGQGQGAQDLAIWETWDISCTARWCPTRYVCWSIPIHYRYNPLINHHKP